VKSLQSAGLPVLQGFGRVFFIKDGVSSFQFHVPPGVKELDVTVVGGGGGCTGGGGGGGCGNNLQ
jgi:hypothetical protein